MTGTALPTTNHEPQTTLRGWVNTFYRHHKGKKLGPYYVRRWKVGRRTFKQYIKPADVDKVREACRAHRDQKREVVRWLNNTVANLSYLERMIKWSEKGKLRPCDHAYVNRIEKEGYDISGRPSLRRRVTHQIVQIGTQLHRLKTVFEFDGTTKVFMVPFFANDVLDQLNRWMDDAWDRVFGPNQPANPDHQSLIPDDVHSPSR